MKQSLCIASIAACFFLASFGFASAQCAPPANPSSLSNVYVGNAASKYYVSQYGSDIWWVGLSADGGNRFTNVFKGTRSGNTIQGTWADTTRGHFRNHGTLTINVVNNSYLAIAYQSGGFSEKTLSLNSGGCADTRSN